MTERVSEQARENPIKYIFVTGGVVSSLGKGLASACIGCLLENHGFRVTLQKLDPYINVDPGTMSPFQHGEVFVTEDGAETDLDLGHYERFTSYSSSKRHNFTSGQIFEMVINKERQGEYLGRTVQFIPHVTDEIKGVIRNVAEDQDIVIVEIGGTIGDIESLPFLEAIRQFRLDVGEENTLFVHVTLIPYIKAAGELKTKPTQQTVRQLREIGVQPDILLCRTEFDLEDELREKIALYCNVAKEAVVPAKDVDIIYKIPFLFKEEGLDDLILRRLGLPQTECDLSAWEALIQKIEHPKDELTIGMVGKYVTYEDSYKSLNEALFHGGVANNLKVHLRWIEAEELEAVDVAPAFADIDGILVPGGFGQRGIEGMVRAVQFARTEKRPFFGICLGFQCSVIEYARNVCRLSEANSSEFDLETPHKVVYKLRNLIDVEQMGGTMRLGKFPCDLRDGTFARRAYGEPRISERHRHRYEFNIDYLRPLEEAGLVFSGMSPDKKFVEIVELADHPWFLACQFHPEFKSRPLQPHPLFRDFIQAAYRARLNRTEGN